VARNPKHNRTHPVHHVMEIFRHNDYVVDGEVVVGVRVSMEPAVHKSSNVSLGGQPHALAHDVGCLSEEIS
jgi:hypothetical protein